MEVIGLIVIGILGFIFLCRVGPACIVTYYDIIENPRGLRWGAIILLLFWAWLFYLMFT